MGTAVIQNIAINSCTKSLFETCLLRHSCAMTSSKQDMFVLSYGPCRLNDQKLVKKSSLRNNLHCVITLQVEITTYRLCIFNFNENRRYQNAGLTKRDTSMKTTKLIVTNMNIALVNYVSHFRYLKLIFKLSLFETNLYDTPSSEMKYIYHINMTITIVTFPLWLS